MMSACVCVYISGMLVKNHRRQWRKVMSTCLCTHDVCMLMAKPLPKGVSHGAGLTLVSFWMSTCFCIHKRKVCKNHRGQWRKVMSTCLCAHGLCMLMGMRFTQENITT